jgi:hypothetical protein
MRLLYTGMLALRLAVVLYRFVSIANFSGLLAFKRMMRKKADRG